MESRERGIAVNQLGYRPQDEKVVIFPGQPGKFWLVDQESGSRVWEGRTSGSIADEASGVAVCRGVFSEWDKPGRYGIEHEDGRVSYPFMISDEVYQEAQQALLKAFYYFRCGMQLEPSFAGPWHHEACHLTHAVVHGREQQRVDAWGGWHDAGDYGKYIVPGAKAAADLLLAYTVCPEAYEKQLPIPESSEDMPDVLHECRYELEWMLRMQDVETGGVYHKLTTLQFPGLDVMPEDDTEELYLSPVSATATACFAAVMAMASRIYNSYDALFAEQCLKAAEQAWSWLELHPDIPGFRNPSDVTTGEYGDQQDADERYWAAAELYSATGQERYHEAFRQLAFSGSFDCYELGWADMGGYGTVAYLMSEQEEEPELASRLLEGLYERAGKLAAVCMEDGYGISLQPQQYIWGSNMGVMNQAMLMLLADRLAGTRSYEPHVLQHVHYLFGANVLGKSYVTGFGSEPIRHPHHRPSEGDGVEEPVPGLVSGGPNQGIQDEYAREFLSGRAPAASFADEVESYSTNEVAIYWNSPALFVLSHFCGKQED